MAAITNRVRLRLPISPGRLQLRAGAGVVVLAAAMLRIAMTRNWWPLALALVLAVEFWPPRNAKPKDGFVGLVMERLNAILVGVSVVLIIATVPRFVTQVLTAGLYTAWRLWWADQSRREAHSMLNLLAVQIAIFEAIFLMAALWRVPDWTTIVLVWAGAYASVYAVLARRGERAAGVLAATWALVCLEVTWVLGLWLFAYTTAGGYGLVPQPALVLSALAYCFGSIYMSQRQGALSRARLTEYLLIGLIMIVIVVIGTSWRGSI